MNRMILAVPVLIFSFMGCAQSLLDDVSRRNSDPNTDPPAVKSFGEPNTITVSWDEDDCADKYSLWRASDGATPNYYKVYEGTGLSYRDGDVSTENIYLYRLYKIRGTEAFGPSPTVMGVASSTEQDPYESNDSYIEATFYEHNITGNLYYYNSYGYGHLLSDADYFCVTVKPYMIGSYQVDVDGDTSGGTRLLVQKRYYDSEELADEGVISFKNSSSEVQTYYFSIFPDEDECRVSDGGGSLFSYTLSYNGEVPGDDDDE